MTGARPLLQFGVSIIALVGVVLSSHVTAVLARLAILTTMVGQLLQ